MADDEFNDMCMRLLDALKDGTKEDLILNVGIVHEIAEHCRGLHIYNNHKAETIEFLKDMDATNAYQLMVLKIVQAPLIVMAHVTVRMFMPVISDKLDNEIAIQKDAFQGVILVNLAKGKLTVGQIANILDVKDHNGEDGLKWFKIVFDYIKDLRKQNRITIKENDVEMNWECELVRK